MEVDLAKIRGVTDWLELSNKQDVQQFLGFCNFYRRFIRDFARVTKLLIELTGKKE